MPFSEIEVRIIDLLTGGSSASEICIELSIDAETYHRNWSSIAAKIDAEEAKSVVGLGQALLFERAHCAALMARVRAAEHLLHGLMSISPQAVLLVQGMTGEIVAANDPCEALFGYSSRELVGMSVERLIPAETHELHVKQREGFLRSIRKREIGYHPPIFAVKKDGSQVEIVVGLTSTVTTEEVMVVCSLCGDSKSKESSS